MEKYPNGHLYHFTVYLLRGTEKWQELFPAWTGKRKPPSVLSFSGYGLKCFSSSWSAFSCPVSFTWHWCSQQRPEKSPMSHWPHCTLLWDAEVLLELFQHPDPANFERALSGWTESSPLSAGCSLPASLWIPGAHQVWCNLSCKRRKRKRRTKKVTKRLGNNLSSYCST